MTMSLPQSLDPDLLRSFVLIAEGRSFTDAATLVGRTQSAVSMQVKRLEEVLGQALLNRGKGGVPALTPHGRYLLEHARQILALNDSVRAPFRAPSLSGTVRLGSPDDYALAYLPAILKRFAETHPAVQVDVRCSPSSELQRSLKAGELDLTLLSKGHAPPAWPRGMAATGRTPPCMRWSKPGGVTGSRIPRRRRSARTLRWWPGWR